MIACFGVCHKFPHPPILVVDWCLSGFAGAEWVVSGIDGGLCQHGLRRLESSPDGRKVGCQGAGERLLDRDMKIHLRCAKHVVSEERENQKLLVEKN